MDINRVTGEIVRAAIKVHSALGPGLLESAYKACIAHELRRRDLKVALECPMPIVYDGLEIDIGYRIDLLVEELVIVELKSVTKVLPLHEAQLLAYLKLSGRPVGLLINFNVPRLVEGIRRMVNGDGRAATATTGGPSPRPRAGPCGAPG